MWNSGSSETQKKTCPLSIATVPRPSRGGQYWDLTASSPIHQGPTTRSHLHPNPWPGRLTSQSCNVRSVLEKPLENGRKKHRGHFFFLFTDMFKYANIDVTKKSLAPRPLCHDCSRATFALRAAPSFRHGTAAQPRSETRSSAAQGPRGVATPARSWPLWSSPRNTRAFPGGPHMAHPNIYTSTCHTSSILIHPHHHPHPYPISSSVIRHPSSFNHASVFHHSSCLHPNQERQEASKCKAWTPRGRWDIKSSKCWPLKCCNPAKDSCTSLPEDSFLASQSSHGITLRSKIYRYTVRCLGSPGQKCNSKDNNMITVVFAVAKRELLHVALYRKNVLLRRLIFLRPRGRISIHVITSTMQIEKLHFIEVKQLLWNFVGVNDVRFYSKIRICFPT